MRLVGEIYSSDVIMHRGYFRLQVPTSGQTSEWDVQNSNQDIYIIQ